MVDPTFVRYIRAMPSSHSSVLIGALILGLQSCGQGASPLDPVSTPVALNASAGDLNPGRGYFQWSGMQVVPPHKDQLLASDTYRRFTWRELQADDGSYTLGPLIDWFDANPGRRLSFRIRSLVDYGTKASHGDVLPRWVPAGIPGWAADTVVPHDGVPDVFIPDWNAEGYLAGVEALWKALAVELDKPGPDGVPRKDRIGWIDLGMYGQYGEWYLRTQASTSSPSSSWVDYSQAPAGVQSVAEFANAAGNTKKRIIDAQLKAFPQAQWVMFFLYEQREVLDYLFHGQTLTTQPVGWRFDALGSAQFLEKQWTNSAEKLTWWNGTDTRPGFRDRWKKAPVVAEFFGSSADAAEALRQLKEFHVSLVGNGNFTTGSGTDALHWARVPVEQKSVWLDIGLQAGWRLSALDAGTFSVSGGRFTWRGSVRNIGNGAAYGPWGARFQIGTSVVPVLIAPGFPLPSESLSLTLTGDLPSAVGPGATWSWSPTVHGLAATWSGKPPSGTIP